MILTEDQFDKMFTFKENHIVPENEYGFETYGKEYDFISAPENEKFVWTVEEVEGSKDYILRSGNHNTNLYHRITKEPHNNKEIKVVWEWLGQED